MLVRVLHRCTRLIVQQCEFSCRGNIGSKDILIKKSNENNRTGTLNINTSCCETVHPHVLMEYTTKSLNIHISAASTAHLSIPGERSLLCFSFWGFLHFFFFFSCYKEFLTSGEFLLPRIEGSLTVQTVKPTEGMWFCGVEIKNCTDFKMTSDRDL